jgi:hypothetical protein
VADAAGINVIVALRVGEFCFGGSAPWGLLLAASIATLPPFAFVLQAIAGRAWRSGSRFETGRLVPYLRLVLGQPLGEAMDFHFQALVVSA